MADTDRPAEGRTATVYEEVQRSPEFQGLRRRLRRFVFPMSAAFLLWYLLYVLLADHAVEIVADRGIHALVGDAAWQTICRKIETAFRAGNFAEGVEQGIGEISALLAQHSPRSGPGRNEIADAPVVL